MGQFWELINLDSPIRVPTSIGDGLKYGEFFPYAMEHEASLLRTLWRPNERERIVVRSLSDLKDVIPALSDANANLLAVDVLDLIFSDVDDLLDLLSIMFTCQHYWDIGRRYLEKLIERTTVVSWAGDRLICISDYTHLDDIPKCMLTQAEFNALETSSKAHMILYAIPEVMQTRPEPYLSFKIDYANRTGSLSDRLSRLKRSSSDGRATMIKTWLGSDNNVRIRDLLDKLVDIKTIKPADFYDGDVVLRNLTTREYLRGTSIRDCRRFKSKSQPWLKDFSFEHALAIRISRSSAFDSTLAYQGDLDIFQGIWAGHRFDMAHIGNVVGEHAEEDWKDVSEVVINEVMEVWAAVAFAGNWY